MPLVLARASEGERHALVGFAQDLGLAYQILGDLLDVEGDEELLGRSRRHAGADGRASRPAKTKSNYVDLLGAKAARERLGLLAVQTKAHLDPFGERAVYLRDSVDFMLEGSA